MVFNSSNGLVEDGIHQLIVGDNLAYLAEISIGVFIKVIIFTMELMGSRHQECTLIIHCYIAQSIQYYSCTY